MKVTTGNFNLSKAITYFHEKKQRSRTFVKGVKAVRLKHMRNTTLRLEANGDYIFRYHDTDIVKHHPDEWVTVTTSRWTTQSTFERIRQASGLRVFNEAHSRAITDQPLRIMQIPWGDEGRAGKAAIYLRRSIPFFEGMRIQLNTGELHPEDEKKLPSERRVSYKTPSVQARQEFKLLWAKAYGYIVMSINFGDWVEKLMTDQRNTYWKIKARPFSRAQELNDIDVEDDADLYNTFMEAISMKKLGNKGDISETIRTSLMRSLPAARKKMLHSYAEDKNMFETKGGQILGNGYFVNPKDTK